VQQLDYLITAIQILVHSNLLELAQHTLVGHLRQLELVEEAEELNTKC
jgi:hypothetical protein